MFSQLNVVEASSFTENEQVLYSRNVVPYSDANIVNYNTNTKAESYEYFDSNFYSNRYEVVNNLLTNTGELDNNLMVDNLNNDMISPMTIIGSDDRTQILNGELWPYRATAKIEVTYSIGAAVASATPILAPALGIIIIIAAINEVAGNGNTDNAN